MSIKELEPNISGPEKTLESWLPLLIPALKARWAHYLASLPAGQPQPELMDWLALLHAAEAAPWRIARYLTQLLHAPKSGAELQHGWVTLSSLFMLTFETASAQADQLDRGAWQNLLHIQNRVLQAAANFALVREPRPDTHILSRRALYLQLVSELHRKFLAGLEPDVLLQKVTSLVQDSFGYDYVSLFLLNQARNTLVLHSAGWRTQPAVSESVTLEVGSQGIASRAAATGQALLVNDVSLNPGFAPFPALPDIKAELAVPLLVGANLVGVLDVASDQANAFCEEDRLVMQVLADHLVTVIENARLQKTLKRYLYEKTLLLESNSELGVSLETGTVLKLMSRKITEAMDAGACTICMADERANAVTAVAEYVARFPGNPARTWRNLHERLHLAFDPISRQVFKSTRPLINRASPDDSSPQVWQAPAGSSGRGPRWGVVLALPLEIERRIIGLLEVYDKNPHRAFSADDIQFCRILTTQTALALERARLLEETRQRLSEVLALYSVAQKVSSSLHLQEVLDTIVASLRQVIGCRGCCIFLLDETGQQLEIRAADGLKPQWRQLAKLRLGEGAAGQAAAQNKTVYLANTHQEPGFIFFDEEVRSLMVIPLAAKGKVIGTINVDDSRPDAFGPAEERLLAIAAAQAGIAIENARLFAEVSAEQQLMQAIIQYTADGLLFINDQGAIVTVNPSLAEMLGLHPGEITGQNIKDSGLHPNLALITSAATRKTRTGVLSTEVTVNTPQPRNLQIFSTTVVDSNKNKVGEVRVVHDVTREREFEQLKDDFMSTVSHELRTPLFSIQGFVQIMLEDDGLDLANRKEFLTIIQHQAAQLTEMVNNLLDLSKLDAGQLEFERKPVAMLDLVHQVVLKLQGFAHRQQVRLVPMMPATLPMVIGDSQRLEQVLTNLVGNAIKFSEAGHEVRICVSTLEKEILVEVQDDGIGIPSEALDRIFSRYYQVEDRSERSAMGSGLGLHIAQKIVEGHYGRIWVESETGRGSTFRFTLPLPELEADL